MSRPLFVAVLVASALPAAFTLDPALDWDTWWHAAVGRWVVAHGQLPDADPFSRPGRDHGVRWVAYSWPFELIDYGVLDTFGERGVLVLRSLLGATSVAAVVGLAARGRGVAPLAVIVLTGVSLMPLMKERPWHVSIVLTTVTAGVAARIRGGEPPRRLAWLPLLFAAWANLHVQFVVGWLVLGLAVLFPGSAGRRGLAALLAACVAATAANPYHLRLYGVLVEYATQTAGRELVDELAPLEWRSPWAVTVLGLLAVGLPVAARRRDGFAVALLIAGGLLAASMRRDVWVVAVAAAVAARGHRVRPIRVPVWAVVFGVFAVARLSAFQTANDAKFPVNAAAFVAERRPPGPLFNPFDWGGYLIWTLPDHPVSIDGRTNLYGDERLRRSFRTWAGDGIADDPGLADARLVVAPTGSPLADVLRAQPDWAVAFEDATAVVFVR